MDFDQLRQKNADAVGWLYLPDTTINYPVLQHGDNDYYLNRQIDGSYNRNGSIFMDYRSAPDFRITTPSFTAITCSTAICSACWWSTRKTAIMRRMTTCIS